MSFKNFDEVKWGEEVFSKIGIDKITYHFDNGQFEDLEEKCCSKLISNVDTLLETDGIKDAFQKEMAGVLESELWEGDTLIFTSIVAVGQEKMFGDVIIIRYKIQKKKDKTTLSKFIPQLWADSCYTYYTDSSMMIPLLNRQYDGEIRDLGDIVKIEDRLEELKKDTTDGALKYTPVFEDDGRFYITADQDKVVVKMLEDINSYQNNPDYFNAVTCKMGQSWARAIDEALSTFIVESSTRVSDNTIFRINSLDIESFISMMKKKFDDKNLPEKNRVAIMPPWFLQKCVLSDLERNKFKESKDPEVKTTGYVFSYDGFDFYKSNSIRHRGSEWYEPIFFIKEESLGFADQVTRMEAFKLDGEDRVGVKGLLTYGMTAIRPSSIFSIKLVPGSENVSEIDKELRVVPFGEYK